MGDPREDYAKLHANTWGPRHQGQTSREAQAALDELEDLRRWKSEALHLLNQWFAVADVIESVDPCPLGKSRVEHALNFALKATKPEADQ